MYEFCYLHCSACQDVRRLGCAHIVEGLPELGNAVRCATCSRSAFMLVEGRGIFCPDCDSIGPARIEALADLGASILSCARCGLVLARLHAEQSWGKQLHGS